MVIPTTAEETSELHVTQSFYVRGARKHDANSIFVMGTHTKVKNITLFFILSTKETFYYPQYLN